MAWYLFVHGEVRGPFDESAVIDWIHVGLTEAQICAEGEERWVDIATHPPFERELKRLQPTVPPPRLSGPVRRGSDPGIDEDEPSKRTG